MLNRRRVLAIGGVATGGALLWGARESTTAEASNAPAASSSAHHEHHSGGAAAATAEPTSGTGTPPPFTPFSSRLPVPPVLRPVSTTGDTDVYDLPLKHATAEFFPGRPAPVLTFGGGFIGPTIKARAGRRVKVRYVNQLDRAATVHLHGGHVPPGSDGFPMDLIEPGQSRVFDYPNQQQGATLWYHDHTCAKEAEHVYRGLAGFYLIEGQDEAALGLPRGAYDVPIMIRDARFDENGGMIFEPSPMPTTLHTNGRLQPYFPVDSRKYRFRVLNATLHRIIELDLGGLEMLQIASDGGLLPEPLPRKKIMIVPGERVEVVVDFSAQAVGSKLVLKDVYGGADEPVMRFDVVRRAWDASRVPGRLRELPELPPATVVRDVKLSFSASGEEFAINDKTFDPARVDTRIVEGTTEIWRVTNTDPADTPFGPVNHTFHMHLVPFRVLDRDGKPPLPGENGLKDTVLVRPGETVRVQATFRGYKGRYLYHCHLQEHSDIGMMAQMEIV
ncbi:multicopper oxidase family protein [Streptomyces sp. NPDC101158]|uniref:multicopper oxidase family protein n=1 Tax=Streptomyces sp. NPDC101158 TaxID=3366117 RepID=UPI0037FD518F